MQQFMSPYTNKRTDKYGDRLYFVTEIIQKIRENVGPDYPIGIRLAGDEFLGEDGITIDDFCENLAPGLEQAGVHWFDISAAKQDLGYAPRVSIAEGLAELEKWLQGEKHAAD